MEFTFNSGTITAKNGATAITSGSMVAKGSTIDFEVKLRAGLEKTKEVDKWMVNSEDKTPTGDKTKLQLVVNENTKVEVSSKTKEYKVDFSSDANGTLTAKVDGVDITTGKMVEALQTVTFEAKPNSNFMVDKWTINGEEKTSEAGKQQITVVVEKDTVVKVTFKSTNG